MGNYVKVKTTRDDYLQIAGIEVYAQGGNESVEKCSGKKCSGYRGYQAMTVNGNICQAWTSQEPNTHKFTP